MGVYIDGYFISAEHRSYDERDTLAVVIAVVVDQKTSMFRVFMNDRYSPDDMSTFKVGDKFSIRARPYVDKNNRLSWTDGEIV